MNAAGSNAATIPSASAGYSAHFAHALRSGFAGCLCFVIADWCQLSHANLAVWTTHMVMAQFTYTMFQRGLERIAGRAIGILLGWILAAMFADAWLPRVALASLALVVFFYLFFSDRLSYTFLNAGLYLVAILNAGILEPDRVVELGESMFFAIILGVLAADVVIWVTRAESDLSLRLGVQPLWPIRRDWIEKATMLGAGVWLVLIWTRLAGISTENATISLMMVMAAPDIHAAIWKGELRLLGAFLAAGWAAILFVAVSLVTHIVVFVALLFIGLVAATFLARAGGTYAYSGVQMGLVLPLIVVVPPDEFGNFTSFFERIQAIVVSIVIMVVVAALWPNTTPFHAK